MSTYVFQINRYAMPSFRLEFNATDRFDAIAQAHAYIKRNHDATGFSLNVKRERETAKRRELGLCIICGKPAAPKATCAACGIKANARRKARASKRGGFDGTVSAVVD